MYLDRITRKRGVPTVGDIFALRLIKEPGHFYFGRVVAMGTKIGGFSDVVLVYVYKDTSGSTSAIPDLRLCNLLFPPLGINRLPWTRGYFESVGNFPCSVDDVLPQHAFLVPGTTRYCDEFGRQVDAPIGPVGFFGLHSYVTLGREVMKAKGYEVYMD